MALKLNPITGNFDIVRDITGKIDGPAVSTDNAIVRFDLTTGKLVQDSGVIIDDSDNVTIPGNLTVNGTTTTVNSAVLDVADANITINVGGTDVSSEGAGLTVQRIGFDGVLSYSDALTSKFQIGTSSLQREIATVSDNQTITNKNIESSSNTITGIANVNISATADINTTKLLPLTAQKAVYANINGHLAASVVTQTELERIAGVTANVQTQIDAKLTSPLTTKGDLLAHDGATNSLLTIGADNQVLIADSTQAAGLRWGASPAPSIFNVSSTSGNFTATNGITYLIDTTTLTSTVTLPAPLANAFVRIKDSTGNSSTNNITINPNAAETIDGAATQSLNSNYAALTLISDGTNWFVV